MRDLERSLERLVALAEHDPDRACTQFDALVARHGRAALARALQAVAGDELATVAAYRTALRTSRPAHSLASRRGGNFSARRCRHARVALLQF